MDLLTLLENEPVEWKKLGDVVEVAKGQQLNKTELSDVGKFPAYNGGKTYSGWTNQYNVEENTIIISQGGASAGYVNFVTSKFWANAHCYYIKKSDKVNNRYIYHVLKMNQESFMQSQHGSGIPALKLDKINKFEIPIPSLETQEKIAKTLDKFTKYVTELQTELQKRIDQYTYYRDKLLSEEYIQKLCKEMEVDRRAQAFALSEIFDFKNGLNKSKEYFGKGIPFVSYMNVYKLDRLTTEDINDKVDVTEDEIERFSVQRGDVLFTRTSEVKEEVGYTSVMLDTMEQCVFNGFTIRGRLKKCDLLLPEFSAHLFRSYSVRKEIIKRSSFTTRASLSGQELGKVEVVIPPLSLQHKIVTILDKFQAMIGDTKGLLPTEIEQRQQQYEYYREKLLTFNGECDSTHARTLIISDDYYRVLREVAKIVDVDIEDKVILYTLKDVSAYSDERISWNSLNGTNYVGVENLLKDKGGKEVSSCVPTVGNFAKFNKGDILIGNIRPYLRKIWHSDLVGGASGDVLVIKISEKKIIESRYLYHILANEGFFEYAIQYSKGAKMPRGDKKKIMEYSFFVPPLHVQQRIVSILDTFNTLVHDMQEGLPKEIKLRQQQYEYYRERLLSFPKASQR